jgi:hypothetical protein
MNTTDTPMAVMEIRDGEEILTTLVTPNITQVGMYKLLAKKKTDGTIEWAHFVQRDSGLKEKVIRGDVASKEELDTVIAVINDNLRKVFGVTMQAADYDVRMLDGSKVSETVH